MVKRNMQKIWLVVFLLALVNWSSATTLEVSIPAIRVPGATIGTEFDVPITVSIPDGVAGQGLARLYIRIVSTGSVNIIAPVANGTKVATTYTDNVTNFGAKLPSFLSDPDNDSDLDAGDAGLVDLGKCPNNSIGIGPGVVVMVQRWKFTAVPTTQTPYSLAVQFPAVKSSGYIGTKQEVTFTTQVAINGSVMVSATQEEELNEIMAIMDSVAGDGIYKQYYDKDDDGEITSTDLSLLLESMN
ncbi:MAG: hypothetical protein WC975_09640 [Phycisphaerae bacterium]